MGGSVVISLSLLSLGPERKVKCYNRYFVNGRKTYNNGVCIKGSTSSEFEVDYYDRLEEVIVAMLRPHKKKRPEGLLPRFLHFILYSARLKQNEKKGEAFAFLIR
jgi:hypothetical protein